MSSNSQILGVVLIARHGDRQGFYQDPTSYTASATSITPLGEQQEFQLGEYVRSLYLDSGSPSYIGTSTGLFNQAQVQVRADAGGEGGVIFDSSIALVQGLFPPTAANTISLANGTNVTSPLQGYQYVPIESVEPNEDVSLEGFTSCNTFATRNTDFYKSPGFLQKANESAAFLNSLPPYLDGRPVTLENMFNIYDFINVQSIHNATFAQRLPNGTLAQVRDLANYHEYGVFSDPDFDGIGNIAARTMLPSILTAMQRIANASDPLKLHYSAISYKPFLSLFNMTGVVSNGELPSALVNYASAVAFEIHQTSDSSEPIVRMQFKNGTDDLTFHTLGLAIPNVTANNGDVPLSTFIKSFEPAAVNTTLQWCNVCAQKTERGCAALLSASNSSSGVTISQHHDKISPVGAGFLGAGLTLAVVLMMLAAAGFLGFLTLGRKSRKTSSQRGLHSEESSVNHEKNHA